MSSFRFLHAADIHLDSPLRGLEGHEREIAERVRTAPRAAFENLIRRALDEPVDFLVIAGDLYDGSWRDYRTGLFFAEQMAKLRAAEIPAFVVHGNHDAESVITKPLVLPENTRVFRTRKAHTLTLDRLGVALHGQSFREKAVTDNLVPGFPSPRKGMFNIGVLHTGLGGAYGHDNYAPCSLIDLTTKGYEYWALGHVHQRRVLHERPYVVFPGNLQGRHVQETGPKGAFLVTVEDGEVRECGPVDLDVVRWAVVDVSVRGARTRGEVIETVREALEGAAAEADGRPLACRIRLEGRCPVHGRLVRDPEDLLHQVRAVALDAGDEWIFVERLEVATRPELDAKAMRQRQDYLGQLQRALEDAGSDPDLMAQLRDDVGKMANRLPPDLKESPGDESLQAAVAGDFAALSRRVAPRLVARLLASGD